MPVRELPARPNLAQYKKQAKELVVAFLLGRGVDVAAKLPPNRQTGLHWAAHGGYPDIVRLLLRHGARVEPRDGTFQGTALDWALHGWVGREKKAAADRYHAVVKLLVAAGATFFKEGLDEPASAIAKKIRSDASMRAALGRD